MKIDPLLKHPRAIGGGVVDVDEDDAALRVREAEGEYFREKRPDLFGRKVDDCGDLAAEELLGRVQVDDLRGAFLNADLGAEIDRQLISRLARLGERVDPLDGADAYVDLLEIGVINEGHRFLLAEPYRQPYLENECPPLWNDLK